jgi:hypothetical protein
MFNLAKLINKHFKIKFEPDFVHVTNLLILSILHELSLILMVFEF